MKAQQGFTLIELAIVLVIVTLLVGGLAMPLSAQIEARRIGETRKTMEEAREAILGYAMSHPIPKTCVCQFNPAAPYEFISSTCPPQFLAPPALPQVLLRFPIQVIIYHAQIWMEMIHNPVSTTMAWKV